MYGQPGMGGMGGMSGMGQGIGSAVNQLQSLSRAPDTMLAHITPGEAKMMDYLQGGRRTNPMTGLPEYGLFGDILKAVARVAASIGGFMVAGPAGAAAGSGIATKLTGGSWKDALTAAAMSGVGSWGAQGLSGAGWKPVGGKLFSGAAGAGAGAGATPGAVAPAVAPGAMQAGSYLGTEGLASAQGALNAAATTASPSTLSQFWNVAKSAPGIAAGVGALSTPLGGSGGGVPPLEPDDFSIAVKPYQRVYRPRPPGLGSGEWQYFEDVNPRPQFRAAGGRIRGYAMGGRTAPAAPPDYTGDFGFGEITLPGYGNVRDPRILESAARRAMIAAAPGGTVAEPGVGGPRLPMPQGRTYVPRPADFGSGEWQYFRPRGMAAGGAMTGIPEMRVPGIDSDLMPQQPGIRQPLFGLDRAAQNVGDLRKAAMIGYLSAKKGGAVSGPGGGKDDLIPARLSNNEHVTDAATIADLGDGDPDTGHRRMEAIKQEIRRQAGRKNPKRPTLKQRKSDRALVRASKAA